jgi:hypothetical protein
MTDTIVSFSSADMPCKHLSANPRCRFYQALFTHEADRAQFAAPVDSRGNIEPCAGRCNERLVQSQRRHAAQADSTLAVNRCIPTSIAGAIAASKSDFPM